MGGCGAESSGSDWGGVVGRWMVSKNIFSALRQAVGMSCRNRLAALE